MFIATQSQKSRYKFSSDLAGRVFNNHSFLSSCNIALPRKQPPERPAAKRSSSQLQRASRSKEVRSAASHYSGRNEVRVHEGGGDTNRAMLDTALSYAKQFLSPRKAVKKRILMRKLAFNPSVDAFYAPQVAIRLIGKIKDLREVEARTIRVSFEKIYKRLISTQLMGDFTADFMETVERYIREIVEGGELEGGGKLGDPALLALSRKEDFMERVVSLWAETDSKRIHALVRHYCIPSKATSTQILQELLADLVVELYEKQSCNRDIEYVLLTTRGQQVTHISQIYFSTQQLLISPRQWATKNYFAYLALLHERDRAQQATLRDNLRLQFEQKIPVDRQDLSSMQNSAHFTVRKQSMQKAVALVDARAKLRGELRDNIRKEEPEGKALTRRSHRRSNDLASHYAQRKRKERQEYGAIIGRLREILDPEHTYKVQSKLHESTAQAFRKLRLFNDKYDITYNHNPEKTNGMFLINLIENCPIFAQRTTEQLEKLLAMLEFVYGRGEDNLSEIRYEQFQEIYETAHGVAPPAVIMKFVLAYLGFDEFGELPRTAFFQTLDICLSQAGRPQRVIKQILWNYLQKLKLVQNDALRRENLQTWYQPVRVVYLLLISLIFGTEYSSLQEMLADLLMDD